MQVKMVRKCNKLVNIVYKEITLNISIIPLYSISEDVIHM